jgi:hypothetical protein
MARVLALLWLVAGCAPSGKPPIYTSFVKGAIGGPCSADSDCESGTCFLDNFAGTGVASVDGYCTKLCNVDDECGGKSICASYPSESGYCTAFCDGPSRCRDGYICRTGKFCDLASFYTLDCDPAFAGGSCTTSTGAAGGCVRYALGTTNSGLCVIGCGLNGPNCSTGAGCHYYDASLSLAGDPFKGLLCYTNSLSTPVPVSGSCSTNFDCVSGANCVSVNSGSPICLELCDDTHFCSDFNATCTPFNDPGPENVCDTTTS